MKLFNPTLLTILLFNSALAQHISPGTYSSGLTLAYDSATKKVTGYFENYTGFDDETKAPRFSCTFYIEGTMTEQKFTINTYFPGHKKVDLIEGTLEIVDSRQVKIKLPEEHDGCFNVEHFAHEPVAFTLQVPKKWIQVRYVNAAKTYFYRNKAGGKRLKSYLVKGNFVCIEKVVGQSAYSIFDREKVTKGWLKLSDLNKL